MKNHRTRTRTSLVVVVKAVAKVGDAHAKRTKICAPQHADVRTLLITLGKSFLRTYKTSLYNDPKINLRTSVT